MPLIKKIDVKNYFANRPRKRLRPDMSTSLPDATGDSRPGQGAAGPSLLRPSPSEFAKDYLAEHSANHATSSASSQEPATSKSAHS
jgi:hypothetical protein